MRREFPDRPGRLRRFGPLLRRTRAAVWSGVQHFVPTLLSPVAALLVVRLGSTDLWGEFVKALVIAQLASHVVAWGNRDFLLREFSAKPHRMTELWQSSLGSRLTLLPLILAPILLAGGWVPAVTGLLVWIAGLVLNQSFDVLVVYRQRFRTAAFLEGSRLGLFLLLLIATRDSWSVSILVWSSAAAVWAKVLLLAFVFRNETGLRPVRLRGRVRLACLSGATIFFLLSLTGMLQSRIDLYAVLYFLSTDEAARYQVLVSFLLHLQSLAYFALTPYLALLYRLSEPRARRFILNSFILGLVAVPPLLYVLHLLLEIAYGFTFPLSYYVLAFLAVLPTYGYLPVIFRLYKEHRQLAVLMVNLGGTGLGLLLNVLLIPRFGMAGALTAHGATQLFALLSYLVLLSAGQGSIRKRGE